MVQRLMNEGEMEFRGETKEQTVSMLRKEALRSLSIDMVEVEDQETRDTRLPPFLHGQVLNNWTSIELFIVFKFKNE